jgi:alpha-beta hydrolase superfamily lysophospholipase
MARRFALALALTACTTSPAANDASAVDGAAPIDAASADAWTYVAPDGGPVGTAIMPTNACSDVASSLYVTPTGLPAFTADVRGTLLGCAQMETISAADLRTRLAGVPNLPLSGGAVRVYLIAYRTEREPRGVGGISTALVYLPDVALSDRVPMVLAAHGTVGLDDHCAPSHLVYDPHSFLPASYMDALYLAWAAAGLPVVAPDYAGLGTDGVHAYGNWPDNARSAIDGVRALQSILPADRLRGDTLVYGHSQGGGIALSVAAYASEAPDVHLSAVVAMAPGYRITSETTVLRAASVPIPSSYLGVVGTAVYADVANVTPDTSMWPSPFAASVRDEVVTDVSTLCYFDTLTRLATPTATYTPPPNVGSMIDATFLQDALACADSGTCNTLAGAWQQRDAANEPHIAPASAPPILMTGSTTDEQLAIGAFGCAVDRLHRDGVTPDLCIESGVDHLDVVPTTDAYGLAWALAASANAQRPPCTASTIAPHCSLL